MKHLTLLLFVLTTFCSTIYSQGLSSIDFTMGAGLSYRSLSDQDDSQDLDGIISLWDDINSKKIKWHLGININKQLSEKIYLKSGLRFSTFGYNVYIHENGNLQWPTQHDGNGGFDPTIESNEPFLNGLSQSIDYWFIEIPVVVRFEEVGDTFSPFIEAGFSANYYLSSRFIEKTSESTVSNFSKEEMVQAINLFGNISLGCNYKMNNSVQLFAQGNYSHQINVLADTPIGKRLNYYGLEIGVRRLFGIKDKE